MSSCPSDRVVHMSVRLLCWVCLFAWGFGLSGCDEKTAGADGEAATHSTSAAKDGDSRSEDTDDPGTDGGSETATHDRRDARDSEAGTTGGADEPSILRHVQSLTADEFQILPVEEWNSQYEYVFGELVAETRQKSSRVRTLQGPWTCFADPDDPVHTERREVAIEAESVQAVTVERRASSRDDYTADALVVAFESGAVEEARQLREKLACVEQFVVATAGLKQPNQLVGRGRLTFLVVTRAFLFDDTVEQIARRLADDSDAPADSH